jgi:hypothetical protein
VANFEVQNGKLEDVVIQIAEAIAEVAYWESLNKTTER